MVDAVYHAALGLFQAQAPLFFHFGGHLAGQAIGGGAFFAEVFKHAQIIKFILVHKGQQFFEIRFGFPGEAHNEIGTQGNVLHALFEHIQGGADLCPVAMAVHAAQNRVGNVLQRNVYIMENPRGGGHEIGQLRRNPVRIAVHDAQAFDAAVLQQLFSSSASCGRPYKSWP